MDFISNGPKQEKSLCENLQITSPQDLFDAIPPSLLHKEEPHSAGMSEQELLREFEAIASKSTFKQMKSFIGAGSNSHYIPAVLPFLTQNSAFLTSYTPYQPEASQGMLQAIFEFQSALATLTGLEIANASMYDGTSALGEALVMASRINPERKRVFLHSSISPRAVAVAKNIAGPKSIVISEKSQDEGLLAYLFGYPAFDGSLTWPQKEVLEAKEKGSLIISYGNPLAYALFSAPGELGVDIAVGDLQPLGIPLQYGGPYCGFMATKNGYIRALPGRIVGESKDANGKRAFTLILQAREQHIRREKALSNICTNQALSALSALIFMSWYGKKGLPELAKENWRRQEWLRAQLRQISGLTVGKGPCFNEFIVRSKKPIDPWMALGKQAGIAIGHKIDAHTLLVAVTETVTKKDVDAYVDIAKKAALDR